MHKSLDKELLQCYFDMRKIFKTNNVDIIAKENRVYVSIKSRKNFFELASLFYPTNPQKQIEKMINQIAQFLYLIDIFNRKITAKNINKS